MFSHNYLRDNYSAAFQLCSEIFPDVYPTGLSNISGDDTKIISYNCRQDIVKYNCDDVYWVRCSVN
jgi:hypothetical protein